MRMALKVTSIIAISLGGLAILFSDGDFNAILGGIMFTGQGIISLLYIKEIDNKTKN